MTKELAPQETTDLVIRSDVPTGLKYSAYRQHLRYDFAFSCAYCTTTESESLGVGFAIDHYEPQLARPDLIHDYKNLMYSCEKCNRYKSNRTPGAELRAKGYRFFRPDEDKYGDHFARKDRLLEKKSNVGDYTIENCDLNRRGLQRIREVRERLAACQQAISTTFAGIAKLKLDELPPTLRGRALKYLRDMEEVGKQVPQQIDDFLREMARSNLLDVDPDAELRAKARKKKMAHLEGLVAGEWQEQAKTSK